jgi:ketopantoate reductase
MRAGGGCVQARGCIRVESIAGDVTAEVRAVGGADEVGHTVDLVIMCTKAWQVADYAPQLLPLLGPETLVLPTQVRCGWGGAQGRARV